MPGFFNRVGTYMAGQGAKGVAHMVANPALARTALGAALGGAAYLGTAGYNDRGNYQGTMGGFIGSALMGAAAFRYGGAGLAASQGRGYANASLKTRAKQFARGMTVMAKKDARGARVLANRGYGRIRGIF